MKSNTVFTGYIEPHESRIPKRSSNAQCLTEGASLERDSSFQGNNQLKLFKMYIGHKDGEVNQKLGKPRNSNHVTASRMKMFYNSQIKI